MAFREGDKLKGSPNYYVWALKMQAIFRAEGKWAVIEIEQNLTMFPPIIDGEAMIEAQLKKKKVLACILLLLSISDNLVGLVIEYSDPVMVWKTFKDQFNSGDQSQVLTLMDKLQSLKMNEGNSIEEYIKKIRELCNRLTSMGERISNWNSNQLVMNGLPRSFESMIQTLIHMNLDMSFEKLNVSLILESYRRQY